MIEKKTFIDQIESTRSGTVQIRFAKCIVEDGKIISHEWHRTAVEPGGDLDAQLAAVDAHLPMIGASPVTDEPTLTALTKAGLRQFVAQVHTPKVVAAFKDKLAAR